jgi:tetratricopeptide (TPR) repeat protein
MRDNRFESLLCPFLYLAWAKLLTGHVGQALTAYHDARSLAEVIADPYTMALVSCFGAALMHDYGDPHESRSLAEQARALSAAKGFPFWHACGMLLSGRAAVRSGELEDGFRLMHEGLSLFRLIGVRMPYPYYLGLLAGACMETDRLEEAELATEEALAMTRVNVDRNYQPDLLRRKGMLLARRGSKEEAEKLLWQALWSSRREGARLLEAHAATALAELIATERRQDAIRILGETLAAVPDPGGAAPFERARRLLAEL